METKTKVKITCGEKEGKVGYIDGYIFNPRQLTYALVVIEREIIEFQLSCIEVIR